MLKEKLSIILLTVSFCAILASSQTLNLGFGLSDIGISFQEWSSRYVTTDLSDDQLQYMMISFTANCQTIQQQKCLNQDKPNLVYLVSQTTTTQESSNLRGITLPPTGGEGVSVNPDANLGGGDDDSSEYDTNSLMTSKSTSSNTAFCSMIANKFAGTDVNILIKQYLQSNITNSNVVAVNPANLSNLLKPYQGKSINWVTLKRVSAVRDQTVTDTSCASGYAFSSIAAIESLYLFKGTKYYLSPQQILDCDTNDFGCEGGNPQTALTYVKSKGISQSVNYPYDGLTENCTTLSGGPIKINSVQAVNGCEATIYSLFSRPVIVGVDASNWWFYDGGIFNNCGSTVNHYVQAVGYVPGNYWLIKNSFGTDWGEKGYIRLSTGNTCGICNENAVWVE